ncbi:DUF6241 domain-containing protein [Sporosarcina sp. JAI121]|uniref:DUF6241 domain-containing protein n=1 Tax=Sporosarcina sp. JAI121 TaxID=2723064 RepID=UPI0015CC54E6|nr:DUF6241 domain-containing protein [Sporosarcina sp. JAI121]NYF23665.1 hypothetical protein [Sporosarcina sp. JAI121]
MKNKKIMYIAAGIVVLGILAYFVFNQLSKGDVTIEEKTVPKGGGGEDFQEVIIEIDEVRKEPIEMEFPSSMDEFDVQAAIHGMSHQKVQAKDKWGFLPLTQDRVTRLIEVVEENKSSYENSELYIRILTRWSNNDFSQADKDHNAIWELQGGNVGRATGILSAEEERKFIKEHFTVQVKEVTPE